MARARNIKPSFFMNEDLVELPLQDRLLFIGLWTLADREGRLEDRPKRIKMEVFPADDIDVDASLDRLAETGMILRYQVGDGRFIEVVNFTKHQRPHVKEAASTIPAPGEVQPAPTKDGASTNLGEGEHALIPDTGYLNADTGMSANADAREIAEPDPRESKFSEFWASYPKKVGKGAAAKAFKGIKWREVEFAVLMAALDRQKKSAQWREEGGRFIPNPATWLNQERWGDDLPESRAAPARINPQPINQAAALIEQARRERAEYEQARSHTSSSGFELSVDESPDYDGAPAGIFLGPGRRAG